MTEKIESPRLLMELGAEGGSLSLYADHASPPRYAAHVIDQTLTFIDEGDVIDRQSDWSSWEDAIKALDRYSWRRLRPIVVHPDIRAQIWALLLADSERIRPDRFEQWQQLCGVV